MIQYRTLTVLEPKKKLVDSMTLLLFHISEYDLLNVVDGINQQL